MQEFAFRKRADIGKSNRARKLTPLKSVGLAFRKDKGDFKSGSKENNLSGNTDTHGFSKEYLEHCSEHGITPKRGLTYYQ